MNKIRIELEIEARPYTEEEYAAAMEEVGLDVQDDEEPDDVDAHAIAELLAGQFGEDSQLAEEMFAGSNIYIKLGDATVIRAEQVPA